MSEKSQVSSIIRKVDECIIHHDTPDNFIETLDLMFQDAVGGLTFELANNQQRTSAYLHYKMLREFLESLKNT